MDDNPFVGTGRQLCISIGAGIIPALLLWIHPSQAQPSTVASLQLAQVCSTNSAKAFTGLKGNSTIRMSNDGGWCWLSLWATTGALLYVPQFNVTQGPAHGELLLGEVNGRMRVAYRPASGFVGEDSYTIADKMSNLARVTGITVIAAEQWIK